MTADQEWLEVARTEYNAAGAEVRHAQKRLDNCYKALVDAAERYGAALVAAGEDPAYVGLGGDA
ncbi:hypothetical protein [Mycolicibacterium austroafricanum]|uniref:hypothetical protein n=1 Tax=Mycolicibacterium austroafricanum TaxID=39687 RepID=UPI001CA3367C|nr:hypothetical protein [Mycolicibacterium austroafricanum]QZT61271.1 hypothetical protein JN085_20095 [Mycolicibacterium austroafricanum]